MISRIPLRFLCLALAAIAGVPAIAQQPPPAATGLDLSGEWAPQFHEDQPERVPGPEIGDYLGLPINDAARQRAESWDPRIWELLEWQCRPHPADYIPRGPSPLRISKEVDPITREVKAWRLTFFRATDRLIYMDGRPHPDEDALHTWGGFSTGRWDGDVLVVKTTHMKEGYIRRDGVARSPKATLTQYFIRHADVLTIGVELIDPVYLTEPLIRTSDYALQPYQKLNPYPCDPKVEVEHAPYEIPNFLPGTNPFLREFAKRFNIPYEATRGGAETMYPDYRLKLRSMTGAR